MLYLEKKTKEKNAADPELVSTGRAALLCWQELHRESLLEGELKLQHMLSSSHTLISSLSEVGHNDVQDVTATS